VSEQGPSKDAIEIRLELSDEQALEFLERLASDDEFRGRYEREPRAVLEEYGITISGVTFPEVASAPSKDALRTVQEEIHRLHDTGDAASRFWAWGPAYLVMIRFIRFWATRFRAPGGIDES
jgi:hypothetical protein